MALHVSRVFQGVRAHWLLGSSQVSIVGRPNVDKSALFNRFVKKRQAIVRDTPLGHVPRDYQEGRASVADLQFLAIDTSGAQSIIMRS